MPALRFFISVLTPVLAIAVALGIALLALTSLGYGREAGDSFSHGIIAIGRVVRDRSLLPGNNYRFWVQSLLAATPLMLTGLAVSVAFRASVLNIGAEGQYVIGSIAASAVSTQSHLPASLLLPTMLLASVVAGGAFAAIAVLLERWRKVPVVLSTLLLNFIALELLRTLLQGSLHEHVIEGGGSVGQVQGDQIPAMARLAHILIGARLSDLHHGLYLALAAAAAITILLRFTTFGFRLQVVGQNPTAARFAGINIPRVALASLAISGGLAGLGGGVQLGGVRPYQLLLPSGFSGYGFTGIAVALLGRLSPAGVILAAIFFGWLNTAFAQLQRELHVPAVAAQAAQGGILLTMLMLTQPLVGTKLRRVFRRI